MLATPAIENNNTYVAVVNSKNDPRRLNSRACELDSIRLLNIEFLRCLPVPSGRGSYLAIRHLYRETVPE